MSGWMRRATGTLIYKDCAVDHPVYFDLGASQVHSG